MTRGYWLGAWAGGTVTLLLTHLLPTKDWFDVCFRMLLLCVTVPIIYHFDKDRP